MERERLLLTLALDMSATKDGLAAIDIFQRYLSARLKSSTVSHEEIERQAFAKTSPVQWTGKDLELVLDTSIPIRFFVKACENTPLDEHELYSIKKIVQSFREKCETIANLKSLTYTDDVTGLYNQRYLELVLDRELLLARRNEISFSVLFLDLDHFKNVNDQHGHMIGSRLLFEVAQEIKKTLRESDITFRYGGDEFVMILSSTDLPAAMLVAERVRVQIEKKRFLAREGLDIRLTASIGVAAVPDHAETKTQILRAADEALYGVKKAVRNSVIAATTKV
jgi:diguanylate cyclase (GGDEF)-like protein